LKGVFGTWRPIRKQRRAILRTRAPLFQSLLFAGKSHFGGKENFPRRRHPEKICIPVRIHGNLRIRTGRYIHGGRKVRRIIHQVADENVAAVLPGHTGVPAGVHSDTPPRKHIRVKSLASDTNISDPDATARLDGSFRIFERPAAPAGVSGYVRAGTRRDARCCARYPRLKRFWRAPTRDCATVKSAARSRAPVGAMRDAGAASGARAPLALVAGSASTSGITLRLVPRSADSRLQAKLPVRAISSTTQLPPRKSHSPHVPPPGGSSYKL
jgi:hypothetical protein